MAVLFFTVDSVEGPGMEKERVSKKGGGGGYHAAVSTKNVLLCLVLGARN